MNVAQFLGPGGILSKFSAEWEPRPQQLAMALAVDLALTDSHHLLVEAGTGTGKTLAYLVPAILSGKKVVVSTGTRQLQEQILANEIPLLRSYLGKPFEAAVLKGISNYVCLRRVSELGDTKERDLLRILDWVPRTRTGERSEMPSVPDDAPAWRVATTTPDARLGPKCPFFDRCFVTQARRAAAKADIIIVNHHLFFADLALRTQYEGAQVIPPYDVVIFDEAHQLEEVVTEHFGLTVSTLRQTVLLRDAAKALPEAHAMLGNLDARGLELFRALRNRLPIHDDTKFVFPEALFAEETIKDAWFKFDAALEELSAHAARQPEDNEDAPAIAKRTESFRSDLATIAERSSNKFVHWAERRGQSLFLRASPIDVGSIVKTRVLGTVESAVFTSATLTAGGDFEYLRGRLGLSQDDVFESAVDSPFDYEKQALLYLPRDLPLPQEDDFLPAALERIAELCKITNGRALVLFTSHRSLSEAARVLRKTLPHPLLVQGEAPQPVLVKRLRETIGSVLLATSSFWEGVDVPGEALSLVILEKLPFAAPDDPLTAGRVRALEESGREPFRDYQLPRAALALKQGFGRLIRKRSDRGIVAILDHRIVTKGYGKTFLDSLPRATRTSALEQVRRWWAP